MTTKLINFRTPEDLQQTFDMVCQFKSQTRTQVLIGLMRNYISANHQPIVNQIQSLQDLNKNLSEIIKKEPTSINLKPTNNTEFERDLWESDDDNFQYPFYRGNI